PADEAAFVLWLHHVSPGYFATLGIPVLQGRDFAAQDDAKSTFSIVVSDSVARRLWPGQSALGKRLKMGRRDTASPWFVVIGVVSDVRQRGLATDDDALGTPDVYFAVLQIPPKILPVLNILVRPAAGVDATALTAPMRRIVHALDP